MKCCDVDKDGFYIVECPLGTRTVWRRETGESWDTGASEPRIMWFETGKELWIPKSVVHDDSEVWKGGQDGDVVVFTW